jgi:hypothetical protein
MEASTSSNANPSSSNSAPKKKRGRIPNKVKEQMLKEKAKESTGEVEEGEDCSESSSKQKNLSKRGRKPKEINFKQQTTKMTDFEMEETVILHLPISITKITEINSSFQGYSKFLQEETVSATTTETGILQRFQAGPSASKGNPQYVNVKTYNGQDPKNDQCVVTVYDKYTCLPTEIGLANIDLVKVTKVNIACWWCCHTFENYPIPCPISFDDKKNIFKGQGCFCSFNCVKAYLLDTKMLSKDLGVFALFYKFLTGKSIYTDPVKAAPQKTLLNLFGGILSIDEFRETFTNLVTYKINVYPVIFIPTQIEVTEVSRMVKTSINNINSNKNQKKVIDDRVIDNAIKRNTVLKSTKINKNVNTLGKLMGLTVNFDSQ